MDATEIADALKAGREALVRYDYQDAYDVAFPLHESGQLSGTDQGDAAYIVGEACYGLSSMDAALHYLEVASTAASSELARLASTRIVDIGELDTAIGAEADGVTAEEAAALLAAGADAIDRDDHVAAEGFYRQAYEAPGMQPEVVVAASLGLARCAAATGDYVTADRYAAYAEGEGSDEAATLRSWIRDQQAGERAAADGTSLDEVRQVWDAATAAFAARQHDHAYELFHSAYESPELATSTRGSAAFNLGMCCLVTHDHDAAHHFFTEAIASGRPEVVTGAQERIAMLERRDEALDAVATDLAEFTE